MEFHKIRGVSSAFSKFQSFPSARIPHRTPRHLCRGGTPCLILSGISPSGSHVGSAMVLSPSRTMWTHWRQPSQIGEPSTNQILRATHVDAHSFGPQPERICVPSACPCPGSPIRAETGSLGCSHERSMDHTERMRGASGPHSATVSPEAVRVGSVDFSGRCLPVGSDADFTSWPSIPSTHQRLIAHELCHHSGFVGRWYLALRVESGRKHMETYADQ
jgi:hypothetical protein